MSGVLLVGALAAQPGLGCVFPADLEPAGADAGPSSPPVIVEVSPPFAPPGPIVVSRENSPLMVLTARDIDVDDILYVRLFVDYGQPPDFELSPPRIDCKLEGPGNGPFERIISCMTTTLCGDIDDDGNHVLEAMIVDRRFLLDGDAEADGQPLFRAVTDAAHAGSSSMSWVMRCQPAQ
jgi:hypothetical protein